MFGKKKKQQKKQKEELAVDIQTMPSIFYGGNDPEIYTSHSPVSPNQSAFGTPTKKQPEISAPREPMSSKKKVFLIVGASIVGVAIIGGISWYYLAQYNDARSTQTQNTAVIQQETNQNTIVAPTTTEQVPEIVTPTTTVSSTVETPPSLIEQIDIIFPSIVQSDTVDIDSDQLTDVEEPLFGTDTGTFDTDGDGYFDGQEVFNLYNPSGAAPSRLIDSGRVVEYISPASGYRLYYPISWQVGNVDTVGNHILISSVDGDYIEIRTYQKSPSVSFNQWFGDAINGQRITDLLRFKNRFEVDGWKRRDDLVAYFVEDTKVHVIVFNPKELGPISHRHIMKMLVQSFRFSNTTAILPDQVIIPGANSSDQTTTTNP